MYSQYPKMRPLGLVIWRLRHSRLRREFHVQVASDVATVPLRGWIPDVGSGPGLLARRVMQEHPEARIVCVDVEPGMLVAAHSSGCGDVVRASANRLPFRSGAFETVLSTASLKDWADRAGGLSEISRVVHPGGRAFVYDFITTGPGSQPPRFVQRFGLLAEILRRRMGRMIPFSLEDFGRLADGLRNPDLRVVVDEVPGFGAARISITKLAG